MNYKELKEWSPTVICAVIGSLTVHTCWPDRNLATSIALGKFVALELGFLFVLSQLVYTLLARIGLRRRLDEFVYRDRLTLFLFPVILSVEIFASEIETWEYAIKGLFLISIGLKGFLMLRFLAVNSGISRKIFSWALFAVTFFIYVFVGQWVTHVHHADGDEPYYLLVAHSLIHDRDIDLSNNYTNRDYTYFYPGDLKPQTGDPKGKSGERYSRHPVAFPLMLTPFFLIAGRQGAVLLVSLITALAMRECYLLSRILFNSRRAAFYGWALSAFTPPFLLYSSQLWVEGPAAFFVAFSLRKIVDLKHLRTMNAIQIALSLLMLVALKLRFGLLAFPLALYALYKIRNRRKLVALALIALVLCTGLLLAWNKLHYGKYLRKYHLRWFIFDRSFEDHLQGGLGVFFDLAFGLFFSSPVYFLGLIGLFLIFIGFKKKPLALLFLCLPYFFFLFQFRGWFGSWCPPGRYIVPLIPILAQGIAAFFALRSGKSLQCLAAVLVLLSLLLGFFYTFEPGWSYNLADGTNVLLNSISVALHADINRCLPSFIRISPITYRFSFAAIVILFVLALYARKRKGFAGKRSVHIIALTPTIALGGVLIVGIVYSAFPPTRIEIEDGWVIKHGGKLYPKRWVEKRPLYTGSWALKHDDTVRVWVKLKRGENRLVLRSKIRRQVESEISLTVAIDGMKVHEFNPRHDKWSEEEFVVSGDGSKHELRVSCREITRGAAKEGIVLFDKLLIR
ncbi:ArnT family glycosyltransferase [Acidobacteriota bacterium]